MGDNDVDDAEDGGCRLRYPTSQDLLISFHSIYIQ